MKEVFSVMMTTQSDIIPPIPLSNNLVSVRIDEVVKDIEDKLYDDLKTT